MSASLRLSKFFTSMVSLNPSPPTLAYYPGSSSWSCVGIRYFMHIWPLILNSRIRTTPWALLLSVLAPLGSLRRPLSSGCFAKRPTFPKPICFHFRVTFEINLSRTACTWEQDADFLLHGFDSWQWWKDVWRIGLSKCPSWLTLITDALGWENTFKLHHRALFLLCISVCSGPVLIPFIASGNLL